MMLLLDYRPDHAGDAIELLRHLRMKRRCEVRAEGDRLWVIPYASLSREEREAIMRMKPHLLAMLAEQERVVRVADKTQW